MCRPISTLMYCYLLFLFLTHLSNLPTSASVIRECYNDVFGAPCSKLERSAIDCIVNSINNSQDQMDITVKITTKISEWKSTHARFCAEWPKIKNKVKTCEEDKNACASWKKSDNICGYNATRCKYLKYANCGIEAGMIKGKFTHALQSELCLETDLNRGLIPYYGPHLQCYENSLRNSGDQTFPLDHYLQFCQQFNHDQLKNCIEAKLAPLTSDKLTTDKAQFISDARRFLHRTSDFCNALSKIDDSILTECRMKNVLMCSEEAFSRARQGIDPPRRGYIACISQQYAKCNERLGAIVNGSFVTETNKTPSGSTTAISSSSLSQIIIFFFVYLLAEIRS